MRKGSVINKLIKITLAFVLILSQIQPMIAFAEVGNTAENDLIQDNIALDQLISVDGAKQTEESTDAEKQLVIDENAKIEDKEEAEDKAKIEESIVAEEKTESVANTTEGTQESVKAEEDTVSTESEKVEEKTTESKGIANKSSASLADSNISFRNENEPEVTAEWGNYGDIQTVTVKADFQGYNDNKKIKIAFDKAIVLQTDPDKLVDGRQILSVDTTNYVEYDIQTSNAGTLTFKEGTIELEVADSIDTVSFNILLSIDERLIDTTAGQIITEDKAIVITSFAQGNVISKNILDKIKVKDELKGAVSASEKSTLFTNVDTAYTVKVSPAGFNTNAAQVDRFYKKIEVRTSIPYTLNGSQKIFADISNYECTIPGTTTKVPGTFTLDTNTQEIIFTCENVYLSAIQIDFTVRFDESKFKDGDIVNFENGGLKIRGALTKDSDPDIEKLSKVPSTGTIVLVTDELVEVNTLDLSVYKDDNKFFHMAGGFTITNLGAASKAKTIRIDFPSGDDALVGAGTIRIILPSHTTKQEIKAELWDKSDNKVYSVTKEITRNAGSSNSTGYAMNLDTWKGFVGLANKDDVYFKSIEYTIDSFSKGYNSGGPNRTVGQTGIYLVKYFAERDGAATEAEATMTITDPSTQQIVSQGTITPIFEDVGVATAALVSETEFRDTQDNALQGNITSGEPFYLYTSTKLSTYQYYNAVFLENPIFRVKVPNGIDIDFTKTVFSFNKDFSTSLDFEVNESNPGSSLDGARIYTFKFKDDVTLGGIKSNFTINDNPIYAKVYMSSQKSVSTLALNTQDTIFLDSESMTLNTGGSWHPHRLRDDYDVNENNSMYDFVFTTDTSKILTFTAPTWIESSFSVGFNGNSIPTTNFDLKDYDDTFELKVNIENNVPWSVNKDSFKYYFPVPKEGVKLASQFKPGAQEFDLSFKEASVSPELKVLYSTDESAYANPDGATYTDTQPSDLNAITMIKIISQRDLVTHDQVEMKVCLLYTSPSPRD